MEFKVLQNVVILKSGLITGCQEQLLRRVQNFSEVLFLTKLILNLPRVRNGSYGSLRYLSFFLKLFFRRSKDNSQFLMLFAYAWDQHRFSIFGFCGASSFVFHNLLFSFCFFLNCFSFFPFLFRWTIFLFFIFPCDFLNLSLQK